MTPLLLQVYDASRFYEILISGLGATVLLVIGWYFIITNNSTNKIWKSLEGLTRMFSDLNLKIDVNNTDEKSSRLHMNEELGTLREEVKEVKDKVAKLDRKVNLIESDHIRIHKENQSIKKEASPC